MPEPMKSTRGVIDLVLLAVLALGAWGYHEYTTVFAPGRNKAKADQAAAVAATSGQQATNLQQGAGAVQTAVETVKSDHAREIAGRDAADKAAGENLAMIKAALESELAPTPAEIVALGYADAAEIAIGQRFTAEQRAAYVKRVAPLIKDLSLAKEAIALAKLDAAAKDAAITELRERSVASESTATAATNNLKAEADAHVATAGKAAELTASNKAWADHEPDMLARIKALGGLVLVLVIGLVWYEIHRRGLAGAVQDAVALKEHVVATAVTLGADAEKLKQSTETWWADDPKAKRLFDAAKAKLRL